MKRRQGLVEARANAGRYLYLRDSKSRLQKTTANFSLNFKTTPRNSSREIGRRQRLSMAGPSLPRQLPPQCASSIRLNNSSSKPPLKTYSKRALQDPSEPSSKRQHIEHPTRSVETSTKSGAPPCTPTLPKKRSISEYFKPVTHTRTPSSPQSPIFSSDPIQKHVESPPSSPPSPHISPSVTLRKTRTRRRLSARPPLGVIKMSGLNAGGSKEYRKGNSKRVGMHDSSFVVLAYQKFC